MPMAITPTASHQSRFTFIGGKLLSATVSTSDVTLATPELKNPNGPDLKYSIN
jgi:hypothetical protein